MPVPAEEGSTVPLADAEGDADPVPETEAVSAPLFFGALVILVRGVGVRALRVDVAVPVAVFDTEAVAEADHETDVEGDMRAEAEADHETDVEGDMRGEAEAEKDTDCEVEGLADEEEEGDGRGE